MVSRKTDEISPELLKNVWNSQRVRTRNISVGHILPEAFWLQVTESTVIIPYAKQEFGKIG